MVLRTAEAGVERVVIVVAVVVPEVVVEVSGGEVAGANGLGKSTGSAGDHHGRDAADNVKE